MSAEPISILKTLTGAIVPLAGVTAHGRLEGLVFELTIEQRYSNPSADNLEAVFTFPLPLRAVLLGFDLEIGGRKLSAVAVEKQQASARYERAIDQGDTAALIEYNSEGLYTVSLGNLMAGESAVIRYRYAELLDAHAGFVRLNIPTVIAPRYGDPQAAGLEGPAIPGADLLAEYPFELTLKLVGVTGLTGVRSPSHPITTRADETGLTVTLSRRGFLDRDFVLELAAADVPAAALVARDGDDYVMLASPVLAADTSEHRPLTLKLLLDCSGSMAGDSIAAARSALLSILDRLSADDQVSLTAFGTTFRHISEGLEPADPATLTPLKALVRRIDADLGGTEMKRAVTGTIAIPVAPGRNADIILITDGEIYDLDGVLGAAANASHRVFAIAIGAAPNEALARKLASKTGGACEFVGTAAEAEAAILRTFKRLRAQPRQLATIIWPSEPSWTTPIPTAVFPDDTVHLFAGFTAQPSGETRLTISDAAGMEQTIRVSTPAKLTDSDLLPRLAAARRLAALPKDEALALAVRHQIASPFTSLVVVAERQAAEKAEGLPTTVAVPHMLAAHWGGAGRHRMLAHTEEPLLGAMSLTRVVSSGPVRESRRQSQSSRKASVEHEPRASRGRSPEMEREFCGQGVDRRELVARTFRTFADAVDYGKRLPTTLKELEAHYPLDESMLQFIRALIDYGHEEEIVVKAFIAAIARAALEWKLGNPSLAELIMRDVYSNRRYREVRLIFDQAIST